MAKPKLQCEEFPHSPEYVKCTASSGEEIGFFCPSGTVPLLRPADALNDHRFVCGVVATGPRTATKWANEHRDVLTPVAAFLLGMVVAYGFWIYRRRKGLISG